MLWFLHPLHFSFSDIGGCTLHNDDAKAASSRLNLPVKPEFPIKPQSETDRRILEILSNTAVFAGKDGSPPPRGSSRSARAKNQGLAISVAAQRTSSSHYRAMEAVTEVIGRNVDEEVAHTLTHQPTDIDGQMAPTVLCAGVQTATSIYSSFERSDDVFLPDVNEYISCLPLRYPALVRNPQKHCLVGSELRPIHRPPLPMVATRPPGDLHVGPFSSPQHPSKFIDRLTVERLQHAHMLECAARVSAPSSGCMSPSLPEAFGAKRIFHVPLPASRSELSGILPMGGSGQPVSTFGMHVPASAATLLSSGSERVALSAVPQFACTRSLDGQSLVSATVLSVNPPTHPSLVPPLPGASSGSSDEKSQGFSHIESVMMLRRKASETKIAETYASFDGECFGSDDKSDICVAYVCAGGKHCGTDDEDDLPQAVISADLRHCVTNNENEIVQTYACNDGKNCGTDYEDEVPKASVHVDGKHCGTDDEVPETFVCTDGKHCGTDDEDEVPKASVRVDWKHCGTDDEDEIPETFVCTNWKHCGTDDEDEIPETFVCTDGKHCGTDDEDKIPRTCVCPDGKHCGTDDEDEVPKASVCPDGKHCGTDDEDEVPETYVCPDGKHCGTDDEDEVPETYVCPDGKHCGTDDEDNIPRTCVCPDGKHCGTDDEDEVPETYVCPDGKHCGTDDEDEVPETYVCPDEKHSGTDDEDEIPETYVCPDGKHCGTDDEDNISKTRVCPDGDHCGTDDEDEISNTCMMLKNKNYRKYSSGDTFVSSDGEFFNPECTDEIQKHFCSDGNLIKMVCGITDNRLSITTEKKYNAADKDGDKSIGSVPCDESHATNLSLNEFHRPEIADFLTADSMLAVVQCVANSACNIGGKLTCLSTPKPSVPRAIVEPVAAMPGIRQPAVLQSLSPASAGSVTIHQYHSISSQCSLSGESPGNVDPFPRQRGMVLPSGAVAVTQTSRFGVDVTQLAHDFTCRPRLSSVQGQQSRSNRMMIAIPASGYCSGAGEYDGHAEVERRRWMFSATQSVPTGSLLGAGCRAPSDVNRSVASSATLPTLHTAVVPSPGGDGGSLGDSSLAAESSTVCSDFSTRAAVNPRPRFHDNLQTSCPDFVSSVSCSTFSCGVSPEVGFLSHSMRDISYSNIHHMSYLGSNSSPASCLVLHSSMAVHPETSLYVSRSPAQFQMFPSDFYAASSTRSLSSGVICTDRPFWKQAVRYPSAPTATTGAVGEVVLNKNCDEGVDDSRMTNTPRVVCVAGNQSPANETQSLTSAKYLLKGVEFATGNTRIVRPVSDAIAGLNALEVSCLPWSVSSVVVSGCSPEISSNSTLLQMECSVAGWPTCHIIQSSAASASAPVSVASMKSSSYSTELATCSRILGNVDSTNQSSVGTSAVLFSQEHSTFPLPLTVTSVGCHRIGVSPNDPVSAETDTSMQAFQRECILRSGNALLPSLALQQATQTCSYPLSDVAHLRYSRSQALASGLSQQMSRPIVTALGISSVICCAQTSPACRDSPFSRGVSLAFNTEVASHCPRPPNRDWSVSLPTLASPFLQPSQRVQFRPGFELTHSGMLSHSFPLGSMATDEFVGRSDGVTGPAVLSPSDDRLSCESTGRPSPVISAGQMILSSVDSPAYIPRHSSVGMTFRCNPSNVMAFGLRHQAPLRSQFFRSLQQTSPRSDNAFLDARLLSPECRFLSQADSHDSLHVLGEQQRISMVPHHLRTVLGSRSSVGHPRYTVHSYDNLQQFPGRQSPQVGFAAGTSGSISMDRVPMMLPTSGKSECFDLGCVALCGTAAGSRMSGIGSHFQMDCAAAFRSEASTVDEGQQVVEAADFGEWMF